MYTLWGGLDIPPAELAAAPQLVVEAVLSDYGVPPLLQASLSPVHIPPGHGREQSAGIGARSIDLGQILPAGRSQSRGQHVKTVLRGISRRPFQSELEALGAA